MAHLFNLFINSLCGFTISLIIVLVCIQLFRIGETRWKLYFLCLPFLKVIYDFYSGIPAESYYYHRSELLHNIALPHFKLLSIGIGFSGFGPSIKFSMAVKNILNTYYPISFSDFLNELLLKKTFSYVPQIILTILLSVSAILIFRRVGMFIIFYLNRKKDRRNVTTHSLTAIKTAYRTVDVYLSEKFTGSPFCGGILNPYICIPRKIYKQLSVEEKNAVIAHELAHIFSFDLLVTIFTKLFSDLFWFLPFIHRLQKKIDALLEILADKKAVSQGESSAVLAATLLKIKEMQIDSNTLSPQILHFSNKNLLKERIGHLVLEKTQIGDFIWDRWYLKSLIVYGVTGAALNSAFFSNEQNIVSIPVFIHGLLKWLGLN